MKCEICHKNTGINWGHADVVLCQEHSDVDVSSLILEREEERKCNATPPVVMTKELQEKEWISWRFTGSILVAALLAVLSPAIIAVSFTTDELIALSILILVLPLFGKKFRLMLHKHPRFREVTRRCLIMAALFGIGAMFEPMTIIGVIMVLVYWSFYVQHYYFKTYCVD